MFLEGIVIIISLVVSIRSTLLQVMTKIPVQNDIIIIIPIYNFRVDTQDMGEKRSSTKGRLKKWEDFHSLDLRKEAEDDWVECVGTCTQVCTCTCWKFERAKEYTNKNLHPLIHGSTACPSFCKTAVCVHIRVHVWVCDVDRVRKRDQRKKASTTWRQIFAVLKTPEYCSLLPLLFIQRERVRWRKLETSEQNVCLFVCFDLCA